MGIWDRLKHELIDIVQYLDDTQDTIVYRFERFNNEIKHGAKLVVREGQTAVFINEGKIADVFAPGTYTLVVELDVVHARWRPGSGREKQADSKT